MRTRLLALACSIFGVGALFSACSSSNDAPAETAATDSGADDSTNENEADSGAAEEDASACDEDAGCVAANQDCIGFGEGSPCIDTSNPYGYTCFGGPPMDECEIATESSLGTTYCCPELTCTHVASGDKMCSGGSVYFECPTADGGLLVSPAEGCTPSTGEGPYAYFCCPN